jgi:hypothetical protein
MKGSIVSRAYVDIFATKRARVRCYCSLPVDDTVGSLFSFVREVSFSHGCAYRDKTHTRRSVKGANPELLTKFAVLFSIDF